MRTVHYILVLSITIIILTLGRTVPAPYQEPVYFLPTGKNTVYLTFNVRWQPDHVLQIIDFLDKHRVQGSFFFSENWARLNVDVVNKMVAGGHDAGLRPDKNILTYDDPKQLREMLRSFKEFFQKDFNYYPFLFRPPGGEYHGEILAIAEEEGYKTVLWGINLQETVLKDNPYLFCRLLEKRHDGSIILLQTSAETVEVLPDLLHYLQATGQTIELLSEMM